MKTVGERIRQARLYRRLSGEELSEMAGYKTQSGISNLENRATGRGGFQLPKIAQALDFSIEWFLDGPDTDDMSQVKPYADNQARNVVNEASHSDFNWPFMSISRNEWQSIPIETRTIIERLAKSMIESNEEARKVA
jgi:transcriptional regulator with XRE-family HTH domain